MKNFLLFIFILLGFIGMITCHEYSILKEKADTPVFIRYEKTDAMLGSTPIKEVWKIYSDGQRISIGLELPKGTTFVHCKFGDEK